MRVSPNIAVRFLRVARQLFLPLSNTLKRIIVAGFGGEQVITTASLGQYHFRCGGEVEFGRTMDYGQELPALAAFVFLLDERDVVWDIGASVGLYTIHAAGKARMVVAFEPDPATFCRLRQNCELNGMIRKVALQNLALGAATGELTLQTDGLDGLAPVLAELGRHQHSVTVKVETVDRLVESGLPSPTVLKLDIEGAEILAIRGAKATLRSPARPRLIFAEIHPPFLQAFGGASGEIEESLREAGYQIISRMMREDQYHLIAIARSAVMN